MLETVKEFGTILVILVVCILVYWIHKSSAIKYYIVGLPEHPEFIPETRQILNTSKILESHNIKEVHNIDQADIVIRLKHRKDLDAHHSKFEYYPGTQKPIRFSFTWQNPKPHIAIDHINWRDGVKESGLTVSQYRRYVIQHEFMHALGYDHQPCNKDTAPGGVCPVLYQSTRGPPAGFKCGHEVTPYDYGKKIPGSYY